ncbi:MAG TPA: hypothetical protein VG893_02295 [Terracidiphilus sp.]|nr:hypothetical protein [Terracidiphilus sp.]
MSNVNPETVLIVFVVLTGLAVIMQAIVLLALFLSVRKTAGLLQNEVSELRAAVVPVARDTHELLMKVGPRIEEVTVDLADMVHGLRVQSMEMQASAAEILERARRQSSRVDAMMTGVLDTVDRATAVVIDAVGVPLRQISGIAAFMKAAFSNLRGKTPSPQMQPTHSAADKDLFV